LVSVFAGLALIMVAGWLYILGTQALPGPDEFRLVTGEVERAYITCGRFGCTTELNIRTPSELIYLWQRDTAIARHVVAVLRPGDKVTVLRCIARNGTEPGTFWSVERSGVPLLTYDETMADVNSRRHGDELLVYLAGGLSIALLSVGVALGIRSGVWRTSA
jgi:hypothetical protein